MSMHGKNHYNIVITFQLIKINEKKKEIPYMWNLKRIDTNEFITKLKQTQSLENKFLVAGVAGGG